jgi:hypothetical protein
METTTALALINGLIGLAFNIYKSLKQIKGTGEIPAWNDLLKQNADQQAEIDQAKQE